MSFLDRIAACNTHDLRGFVPFHVGAERVGWVRPALARRLAEFRDVFAPAAPGLALDAALADFDSRSRAMDGVVRTLEAEGRIAGRRDEFYAVTNDLDSPPLLQIERCAVAHFGLRAYGVHMTGYVRRPDGPWIWVPRRALTKSTYPGMLDSTVAGGQPIGLSLIDNLVKECREEAGIPEALARQARFTGTIRYCAEAPDGLKPDVIACYDLEMPESFEPRPVDGEMDSFELWPAARVVETVRDTEAFKFNCNLVLIDFFLRHAIVTPPPEESARLRAALKVRLP
ncbi:MAG: DUF4743 domain-containing protein [Alphaproteobacteria bacterium]|nr:DUF4743 domain-containing protein [Alphaproteobacteria bacterium]